MSDVNIGEMNVDADDVRLGATLEPEDTDALNGLFSGIAHFLRKHLTKVAFPVLALDSELRKLPGYHQISAMAPFAREREAVLDAAHKLDSALNSGRVKAAVPVLKSVPGGIAMAFHGTDALMPIAHDAGASASARIIAIAAGHAGTVEQQEAMKKAVRNTAKLAASGDTNARHTLDQLGHTLKKTNAATKPKGTGIVGPLVMPDGSIRRGTWVEV